MASAEETIASLYEEMKNPEMPDLKFAELAGRVRFLKAMAK